jgi:hypothetical protein
MELSEFITVVGNFDSCDGMEKIKLLAWHLHAHEGRDRFDRPDIRKCFANLHQASPDLSVYFPRLIKAGAFLKDRRGIRLEGRLRTTFDQRYSGSPVRIAVTTALKELPDKLPDLAEQVFLKEALACYSAKAFRATIVMTWNLAFHHLEHWLLADSHRLAEFNAAIPARFPKKPSLTIAKIGDFEGLKEFEFIEVLEKAGLISGSMKKILNQKLEIRNIAAHPSNVMLNEPAANEYIITLLDNIVLKVR